MRLLLRIIGGLLVVALFVAGLTAAQVWNAGRQDARHKADVIVVLGAAQYDGRPQDYLAARLEHAKGLYDAKVAPRILTLGGKRPGDRFTEADAGQSFLVEQGVRKDRVLRVGEGSDTLGSLQAAAAVMKQHGWTSAVVVTDPWHELRSTSMLSDQGITAYSSPTTTGPSVQDGQAIAKYVARETAAYLAYEIGRRFE